MKKIGYTYSVSLPEPPIASRIPDHTIDHATKVWIDGKLVWQTGDPGTAAKAAYRAMFCDPE